MRQRLFQLIGFLFACWLWVGISDAIAASGSPSLAKAKQEAEAKGFVFVSSRDEIIAKAKAEGRVNVLMSMNPSNFQPIAESFKKKYPFLDVRIQDITGSDAFQAFLLGLKAELGQRLGRGPRLHRSLQRVSALSP